MRNLSLNTQNLLTIIKKEIWMYIISFSNFLVFAGVMAVVVFLFFNSFYATGASGLDDLFNLFPWVFALLVPAVAMGIIAQERREKTLTYLLSSPINVPEIVIGKFLGAWAFLACFPLLTLVIPTTLQGIADFDWGVLLAGYIASFLLVGVILAIDMWVSSLFKNQLAAFVLSFGVNFLIILLGTNLVTTIFPLTLTRFVAQASPMDHFMNLSRGLLTLSDLVYFTIVIVGFLLLTIWQVMRLRLPQNRQIIAFQSLPLHTVAIALLVGTFFTSFIPGKLDLTRSQIFTVAEGTRNILSQVEENVTIDVYVSRDLPPAFQPLMIDLQRLLGELGRTNSKLQVNYKYPQESEELTQEAQQLGITPQPFTVVSQTEYQQKEGYLGMNIKYKDKNEVIPFLGQTEQLEYQIMSLVFSLSRDQKPTIAILSNQTSASTSQLSQMMASVYSVNNVPMPSIDSAERLKAEDLNVEVAILIGVNQAIHPDDQKLIVDKVNNGMSLIVMENGANLITEALTATTSESVAVNDLLKNWKVQIQTGLVYDEQNGQILGFNTPQGQVLVQYAFWPTVGISQEVPLLKDLQRLTVPWPSSISIEEGSDMREILRTSDSARLVSGTTIELTPDAELNGDNPSARIIGAMRSRGEKNGAVIVIGSSSLPQDNFLTRQNNSVFVGQLIDLAAQSRDLASIRLKNRLPAPLVFTDAQQKVYIRYSNLIGLPAIPLILGGVMMYLRKKKIVEPYSPTSLY